MGLFATNAWKRGGNILSPRREHAGNTCEGIG
jgi:hypothetical protein